MFRKDTAAGAAIDSLVGARTRIQGDLVFAGGLHLDGSVAGSVKPEGEGASRLVIGESGVIEGSCEAQLVELHGTVKGDITARQRVVLGPRACVEGNLSYGAIEMAAGATIKGKLLKDMNDETIQFTDAAAAKVAELIQGEGNPELMLRVYVQGGGCSGMQYGFEFDESVQEGDTQVEKLGVKLLVDPMSYQYLSGAEIDYREGLEGAQFVIRNPNAHTTCGCGSSFAA